MSNIKTVKPNTSWVITDQKDKEKLGATVPEVKPKLAEPNTVHGYDVDIDKPFNKMFYVKRKLPIFTKENKSKSFYCAGHYLVQKKSWTEMFCPKLITLQKYKFHGPFKNQYQMNAFKKKFL